MWVAHLFGDKGRMGCHRSPEFCNGSDLQPTRTYCRTALHVRSQGVVIGQGSVAESWLAVTQGACTNGQTCAVTFCKNNRLFDGEARCCKTVDNHTSVMRARVAPTMRAAERASIRTGKVAACLARMLTLLPLRLQHGLLPSCIGFPSTFGRSSFGSCGPAAFS
jgi:hypothetical protein